MKKKVKKPPAPSKNRDKGASATTIIWQKAPGSRGKQLNPNQRKDNQPPAPQKSGKGR